MILAYKLGHEPFRDWINRELNGYQSKEGLPDYRVFRTESRGNFDAEVKRMTNARIPDVVFDEQEREIATKAHLVQGVGSLVGLESKGELRLSWPDWMLMKWSQKIYGDYVCLEAWLLVPPGAISGVLSAVRNRIVEFTLSIEAEAPDIDGVPVGAKPVPMETVEARYQTIILGNGHAINLGDGLINVQQIGQQVVAGDLDSLRTFLRFEGIADEDLDELSGQPVELGRAQAAAA